MVERLILDQKVAGSNPVPLLLELARQEKSFCALTG
jgi:hypothetical protein